MRRGVKTDARGECLRLCPDILNPEEELQAAARAVGTVLSGGLKPRPM